MLDLLNKLRPGYTVHGFRSSFADWAAEHDYPQELREMALGILSAIPSSKPIGAVPASTKGAK